MGITCPGCGSELKEDAAFCDLCHRPLRREAGQYPPAGSVYPSAGPAGSPPPPPVGQPYTGQPPYAGQPPMGWTQPPPQAYRQQAVRARPDAYQNKLILSTLVLAASGVVIAICTFLPFITMDLFYARLNVTGWNLYQAASEVGTNPFYLRFNGMVSVFTGLSTLLLGLLITGLAVAMLIWRRLEISYAIFPATLLALGISLINVFNIWRLGPGVGLGLGSILCLVASIAAIICGVFVRNSLSD